MKPLALLYLAILVAACKPAQKTMPADTETAKWTPGTFDKQGHRGCRGVMPENTIPAMISALGMGVTTLEMDIVITKDKKVILSHEPWFEGEITTKPGGGYLSAAEAKKYNIYQMTYAETQAFDVGMKPHPRFPSQQKMAVTKPLLSDLIDSVKQWMMTARRPFPFYNIETKTDPSYDGIFTPSPEEVVDLLMDVINKKGIAEYVIIQSFDFRTLRYLHKKYPAIATAMLVEDTDKRSLEDQIKDLGFTPSIYSPAWQLVTKERLDACHKQQVKVIPWTVNDKAKANELRAMGVDGIITDYPEILQ